MLLNSTSDLGSITNESEYITWFIPCPIHDKDEGSSPQDPETLRFSRTSIVIVLSRNHFLFKFNFTNLLLLFTP